MNPVDIGLAAGIVAILALIGWYLYRAKKSGRKCIGCPDSGSCGGNCGSCSGNCGGCSGNCGKCGKN
jgi:hypothetical protein